MRDKSIKLITTFLVLLFLSSIFNFSTTIKSKNENFQINIIENKPKASKFWNLTGSPILIDDSDPSKNWSYTASHYDWCSGSGNWIDPYIIENVTIDGQGSGNCIEIKNSDTYFVIQNCSIYNSGSPLTNAGIKLDNVDNSQLINNNCSDNNNNLYGIQLDSSNNNTLSGNTASNNNNPGISLYFSNNNTLSGNIACNNSEGISLYCCNNNTLSENLMYFCKIKFTGSLVEMASHSIDDTNLVNNKPVYYYVNELGLGSSNFTNAGQIILISCNNSKISRLNISDGSEIYLWNSDNNTISGNTASNNIYGIYLYYSDNNNLSGNTANNNFCGIYLLSSNNNTLSGNAAINNSYYGIQLWNSDNNAISGNIISNNSYAGINLGYSNNNTLLGNTISNNSNGTRLDSNSNNNKIVLNHFINNEINAEDYGINNTWDDGFTGNYWDDYASVDANDDGIGDTPYIISGTAGSQDNFPIWTDGDDITPVITITFPLPDSVFGLVAPNYTISIDELNLDTIWYTLDGGITNYTITGLAGTFKQLAWDALSEGNVTIRFYANDTAGNIGFQEVIVVKEITQTSPPGIPGYDLLFLLGIISAVAIVIIKKRVNDLK